MIKQFKESELKKLYTAPKASHKGQNGRLMIIGGSHLFHGASLWALKIASRIVDMVFYSSVPENLELTKDLKKEIYDFIAVPREKIEEYIKEADAVLIGPGMVRNEKFKIQNLGEIREIKDEGVQTYHLTKYLLDKYRNKKWVIDAGSLQMMEPEWLKQLNGNVIITPHHKEFEELFNLKSQISNLKTTTESLKLKDEFVQKTAKEYNCVTLLKGVEDIICSPKECVKVSGGNPGMTKGGTGDVLAGLAAALSCKNDLFLSAKAASFINKYAGEKLYKKVGPFFNASDLADEIPKAMKELLFF